MAEFNKHVEIGQPAQLAPALDEGMVRIAEKHANLIAVLEDLGYPAINWFKENAPERILETGIAEGNAAVVAAGLAAEGYMPVIYGLAFATLGRALNQIRQSILVDRFNVKLIARAGAWGEVGISHNSIEDVGYMRVLPNLVILNPADAVEAVKAMEAMADYHGPVYFRLEAGPRPLTIFKEDYPFGIGKAYSIRDGRDATIIATGYMVTEAVRAVDILEKEGIDAGVLNMSTIKPLDEGAILAAAEKTGAVVTAENCSVIGGLGEGVAAVLSENLPTPLVRVGIEDEFSQSGRITPEKDDLKEHFALGAEDLAVSVKEAIALKVKLKK